MKKIISNEQYHALDGVSASGLKMMRKSYRLYYVKSKLMRTQSDALDVGTAVHEAILEPDLFNIDNYNFSASKINSVNCMINNCKVMFNDVLKDTEREVSYFYENKETGFLQKVRVDAIDEKRGFIFDLKTTKATSPSEFEKESFNYGYHIQTAFYIDTLRQLGYNIKAFAFLVIPSQSPFEPFAFQASKELIEYGRHEYSMLLDGYSEFLKTKDKPNQFLDLRLPFYMRNND